MENKQLASGGLWTENEGDGEWMEVTPGERFLVRTSATETGGVYTVIEVVAQPRNGVPLHVHQNEDEHFVVLEGTVNVANGEKRFDVPAGSAITVGKGIAHAWCNLGEKPARFLVVLSPGGLEALFKAVARGPKPEELAGLAEEYGTVVIGPPMYEGIYSFLSPRE